MPLMYCGPRASCALVISLRRGTFSAPCGARASVAALPAAHAARSFASRSYARQPSQAAPRTPLESPKGGSSRVTISSGSEKT